MGRRQLKNPSSQERMHIWVFFLPLAGLIRVFQKDIPLCTATVALAIRQVHT